MSMLMTQIPDAGFRPFADMPLLKSGLASILRFRVWKGWAVTGNRCRISSINSTNALKCAYRYKDDVRDLQSPKSCLRFITECPIWLRDVSDWKRQSKRCMQAVRAGRGGALTNTRTMHMLVQDMFGTLRGSQYIPPAMPVAHKPACARSGLHIT